MGTVISHVSLYDWNYNSVDDVYWKVGVPYCENPTSQNLATMGIYVPGAYFDGKENNDGLFNVTVNTNNKIGTYTAESAPIVLPVDTPGYMSMSAPTGYSKEVSAYTDAGFVYISAGCRGRDAGAPAGVTDLKAAIRFIRFNNSIIPGCTDKIFSFGMSGGGAQSALLGATGDAAEYTPYLEAIGAIMSESDAVAGSMCWCPITALDIANEAYEWNMGSTRDRLDTEAQRISDEMARQFALYITAIGLKDELGNMLMLEESAEGIYQSGSYNNYLKCIIEDSLNAFLASTDFPYTVQQDKGGFHGGRMGFGNNDSSNSGIKLSGTYNTVYDYVNALNTEKEWVIYNEGTNTATITSVADFASALKPATKSVGAFDGLNSEQGENTLFGYADGKGAHFDAITAHIVSDTDYSEAFKADLARTDSAGNTAEHRENMYNPMYYLCDYYNGAGTSAVAEFWKIRCGINQGDTALTTEINLALALQNEGYNVDFAEVWGQGHTEAEQEGTPSDNFIAWVNECVS